ncbi:MAG TPA: ATP-binding protein [Patescibacteria group bacterium]|nr:ATP-binding protein [Patescibacteria group bacterium]
MYLYFAFTGLFNAIVSTLLGIFVFFNNSKNNINRSFALFCLFFTMWSAAYIFWPLSQNAEGTLLSFRLLHIGAAYVSVAYLHFVCNFLDVYKQKKVIVIIGYILASILVPFIFTPYFIADMVPIFSMRFWAVPGILYHFYLVHFFGYFAYSSYLLFKSYKKLLGVKKVQILYILVGFVLAFFGGSTNYFLWYKINIPPYLNILACSFVVFTAYAIVKTRFLDIKFVLRSSFVYISSLITIIIPAVLIKFIVGGESVFKATGWIDLIIVIFAIAVFPKVKEYFYKIANKYFFSSLYDSAEVIADLSDKLRSTLDINKIDDYITNALIQAFHCKAIGILNYSRRTGDYNLVHNKGFAFKGRKRFLGDKGLHKKYVMKDEPFLTSEIRDNRKYKKTVSVLEKFDVEVLTPLNVKDKTIGLIAIGAKESGDSYNQQDIELLGIVSAQSAIAIENAILYEKTRRFTKTLQVKVDNATAQIRHKNEELKKLDKLKDEFISVASHQLRTPLTATRWALEFLIKDNKGKLNRKQLESVHELEDTNSKLIKLVNSLLNVSRIDEGRLSITPVPTDIVAVMKEIMHEFEPIARHKNLKVITHYDKLPKIKFDPVVINKAIHNFVSNAIKYNKDEGRLWINVEKYDKDNLVIKVRDEGIGIPKAEQANLFAKFYRASNAATSNTEGTGLGLYIAKSAVESSGGKVWFESKENEGTTFFVTLPLKGSRAKRGEKSLV